MYVCLCTCTHICTTHTYYICTSYWTVTNVEKVPATNIFILLFYCLYSATPVQVSDVHLSPCGQPPFPSSAVQVSALFSSSVWKHTYMVIHTHHTHTTPHQHPNHYHNCSVTVITQHMSTYIAYCTVNWRTPPLLEHTSVYIIVVCMLLVWMFIHLNTQQNIKSYKFLRSRLKQWAAPTLVL